MKTGMKSIRCAVAALTLTLAGTASAARVIEIHNTINPGGAEEVSLNTFKKVLEEKAPGQFDVRIYLGGQLGGEDDVLELLKLGQTQMALTGTTYITLYADEVDAVNLPFVLPSWEASSMFLLETDSGKRLLELARERGGLHFLGLQKRGPRHMTSNRPVEKVEDLKGLKMRMPPQPSWIAVWEGFGVQAVVLPAGDIYLAMRTGQIDGHENTLASPYSRQMWEVQKYIIRTGHLHSPWSFVASEDWWKTLNEDERRLIEEAVAEAAEVGGAYEMEQQQVYIDRFVKEGMQIIDVDLAAFNEAAQPALEKFLAEKAPGVVDDVRKVVAETVGKKN